ncbi:MAG: PD-(D/E)XK nuclease family protein [Acidobacteriota bacterium]
MVRAHGVRAVEDTLLDALERRRPDATELSRPIRVVVPSRSLRRHLLRRLASRGAWLGLIVQTHWGLVLETLRRTGRDHGPGNALLPVLIERLARRQPALRTVLDDLDDGYRSVIGSVGDVLDAGFETVHAEPLDDLLVAEGPGRAGRDATARARALLMVARRLRRGLDDHELRDTGLAHQSDILRAARDALRADPQSALPTRAVLIHGYTDATGVVTDLLETLLRVFDGTVFFDRPMDPATGQSTDFAFGRGLRQRLIQAAGEVQTSDPSIPAPTIQIVSTPDVESELRFVASAIRTKLDAGYPAEDIAVVARALDPYLPSLREVFDERGIPFSTDPTPGLRDGRGRRLDTLMMVLADGAETPLDVWLDLLGDLEPREHTALRQTFFGRGASRLGDVAKEPKPTVEAEQTTLPFAGPEMVTEPLIDPDDDQLTAARIAEVIDRAVALLAHLDAWFSRSSPTFAEHRDETNRLVDRLGWSDDDPARLLLTTVLDDLDKQAPASVTLDHREFRRVLASAIDTVGRPTLGSLGGGVQVLDVTAARARSFRQLFVVGLTRDRFPRPIHTDPLLGEPLRALLRTLLPDLPLTLLAIDEERFLFAQVLSASPEITLSWPREDGGRPRSVSPLVERLPIFGEVRHLDDHDQPPVTAVEHLQITALAGARRGFAALLPVALRATQTDKENHAIDLGRLAHGRIAVLNELDPDLASRDGRARRQRLGPYFGFVGRGTRRTPAITHLEDLAACPWQTFLRRVLELRPMPDPLASLPNLDVALVGQLVHEVLEQITAPGDSVAWPEDSQLDELIDQVGTDLLGGRGLGGLRRAAAALARPYLEVARKLDWKRGPIEVLGTEVKGALIWTDDNGRRRIPWRADRVDRHDHRRRITDYKTGGVFARGKNEAARREELGRAIRAGAHLQTAAYLRSAQGDEPVEGRYLFLRPDLDEHLRTLSIHSHDHHLLAGFDQAVSTLLALWDAGAFFPRLVRPDEDREPRRCAHCSVAEACVRRDSGARGRLREWAEANESASRVEDVLLNVWRLPLESG